jgi:UDP-GlcNAc:undecaprenyl-phosphate/decaprenyl-phosphate GlcNAc-1-phosphate transferase
MKTAAIAFILSMFCGALLTPIVRKFAVRFGLLDHALSSRKIHGAPIPRVGGVAIVIAFYAPLVGLTLFQTGIGDLFLGQREHVRGLFTGGLAIALLGLYDDLRGTKARLKFLVQFGVAGLLYHWGFRVELLANPFGNPIALGWISLPFTLLWIVGVINAMNLIDGLDGLAGGVALVAVIITFVISVQRGEPLMMLFTSALAGSILGFLFYNFNPASIFMGDTGSMFLGFVLATTAIQTNQKASTAVAVLVPGVALGLPLLDTLLALTRRAVRGRPLFQADREHIHHRLIALGLSHRQAVLVLYGFCVLLGAAALMLTYTNSAQSALLLVVMALVAFFFLRSLGYVRFDRIAESAAERKRNKAILAAIRPLGQRLRQFQGAEAMWPSVIEAATAVGATGVSLWFKKVDDGERFTEPAFSQNVDPNDGAAESYRARFAVPSGRRQECQLELGWTDGRREIDRDTEIAIDIFCEYLGGALELVPAPGVVLLRPGAGG